MSRLRLNPFRLLNSVPFGIGLMVLIALYLAAGSGRQWLRTVGVDQWPLAREWFDKTDLQFFNAWPLKVLMGLLVTNLTVVTWRKIPLTPPRYGVWCVHAGIITLVLGSAAYYSGKLEGRVRLYADPSAGPNMADGFYDKDERALYVRTGRDRPASFPLPTLPRFQQYDQAAGTESVLARRGLSNIDPSLSVADAHGKRVRENVAEQVGVTGDLKVDVIGYYPYAAVRTDFDATDPASKVAGVEVSMGDPRDPQLVNADWYVVASDPRYKVHVDDLSEAQHIDADKDVAAKVAESARQIFRIDAAVGGGKPVPAYVQVGQAVPVAGAPGYTLAVEGFDPTWSMGGSHSPEPLLTLLVTTPTQKFRRMLVSGRPGGSDFRLAAPGVPPSKMRTPKPLDADLHVAFTFADPYGLLPQVRQVRHTLLTPAGSTELVDVAVSNAGDAVVRRFPGGRGDVSLMATVKDAPAAEPSDGGDAPAAEPPHPGITAHLQRHDHLDPQDVVMPVPPGQREAQADEDGSYQAVKLRLHLGTWEHDLVVPYTPDAADRVRNDAWRGGIVMLPGALAPLQFQLGNTRRPLPVRLTLDSFKAVPFPGGTDSPESFFADYRSTVTLSGAADADTVTEVASLNSPIYFGSGRWLFFQHSYDPNVPHEWTQLGVGNRPAVGVMVTGCGLIFAGLLYAFYAKPVIVRRMKQRALTVAAERAEVKAAVVVRQPELVES